MQLFTLYCSTLQTVRWGHNTLSYPQNICFYFSCALPIHGADIVRTIGGIFVSASNWVKLISLQMRLIALYQCKIFVSKKWSQFKINTMTDKAGQQGVNYFVVGSIEHE